MKRKEFDALVAAIAREEGVSMTDTGKVIRAFMTQVERRTDYYRENPSPAWFGILTLDAYIRMFPGITFVYGFESTGKTSLAQKVTQTFLRADARAAYIDAENKLFLHECSQIQGGLLVNATAARGLEDLLHNRLLEFATVDTVSALMPHSANIIMHQLRKSVPYCLFIAQMRNDLKKNKTVPATNSSFLGISHTQIHLTSTEQITMSGIDMMRVHFTISKYEADRNCEGIRDRFIVRNNRIDNLFTAIDMLRSAGRIESRGPLRYLDGEEIGDYKTMLAKDETVHTIFREAWNMITKAPLEVSLYEDHDLRSMQARKRKGSGAYHSPV